MNSESILENRKYYQRNKILSVIRFQKNVSRYDIKKSTSYSMTTVLSVIEDMLKEGLIYEEECDEIRVGRKPVWLRLNPQGGYFVGLEFNSRTMHCVILDFTGRIIYTKEREISERNSCAGAIIDMIKGSIRDALESLGGRREKVLGIGLGIPGYSDKHRGVAISYTHLKGWENVPVKQIVEEEFGYPCYMDNNVNGMIYAYKYLVYNGRCEDMLFISIRTGARVMPVINNMPVSSVSGSPGELGHIKVGGGSRLCSCGKYGCLNTEVSDYAIVSKIKDGIRVHRFQRILEMAGGSIGSITIEHFVEAAKAGDADSLELLEQVGGFIGDTIAMLVNIFAPRKIVIYGELARIGEPFLKILRKRVEENSIRENYSGLEIMSSTMGRDLGAVGAAALVMQEEFDFVEETI